MNRLLKYFLASSNPGYWSALRRGVVPSVEHRSAFERDEFETVIDVGANKGQFATFAQLRWPAAELICIEPLSSPRHCLERVTRGRATVLPFSVGDIEGDTKIYLASRLDSSSLFKIAQLQKQIFSTQEAGEEVTTVKRLENVIDSRIVKRPALLKIDVQGFEYEVLKGAGELLEQIDIIYVELSYIELYQGQKLANHVFNLLEKNNFDYEGRYNSVFAGSILVQADHKFCKRF